MLVLKAIEDAVADTLRRVTESERELFHRWLVGACMEAYFAEEAKPPQGQPGPE